MHVIEEFEKKKHCSKCLVSSIVGIMHSNGQLSNVFIQYWMITIHIFGLLSSVYSKFYFILVVICC